MFFCERAKKLQCIKLDYLDNYSSSMDEKSEKNLPEEPLKGPITKPKIKKNTFALLSPN